MPALEFDHRLRITPLGSELIRQIAMSLGKVGFEPHGLLERENGFVGATLRGQCAGERAVNLVIVGSNSDCLTKLRDRVLEASLLLSRESEVMMRGGVPWTARERCLIFSDRFVETAPLAQGRAQNYVREWVIGPAPRRFAAGSDSRVERFIRFPSEAP